MSFEPYDRLGYSGSAIIVDNTGMEHSANFLKLKACSDYFNAYYHFTILSEKQLSLPVRFTFPDVSPIGAKLMIKYSEMGETDFWDGIELIKIFDRFLFESADIDFLENLVLSVIDSKSAFFCLDIGRRRGYDKVVHQCIFFINKNHFQLMNDFENLDLETFLFVLEHPSLTIPAPFLFKIVTTFSCRLFKEESEDSKSDAIRLFFEVITLLQDKGHSLPPASWINKKGESLLPQLEQFTSQLSKKPLLKGDLSRNPDQKVIGIFLERVSGQKGTMSLKIVHEVKGLPKCKDMKPKGINEILALKMFTTAFYRGKLYIIGGLAQDHNTVSTMVVYDVKTNVITRGRDMPRVRAHAACIVYKGRVYVSGGSIDGIMSMNNLDVYDPIEDTWTPLNPFRYPRRGHTMVPYNGSILMVGGVNKLKFVTAIESYDVTTGQWFMYDPKLQKPVFDASCCVTGDGHLLIVGGSEGDDHPSFMPETFEPSRRVSALNLETKKWVPCDSLSRGRALSQVTYRNGHLYVFGGTGITKKGKQEEVYEEVYSLVSAEDGTLELSCPRLQVKTSKVKYGNNILVISNQMDIETLRQSLDN